MDGLPVQHLQGLLAVIGFEDLITFVFQIDLNGFHNFLLIVAD